MKKQDNEKPPQECFEISDQGVCVVAVDEAEPRTPQPAYDEGIPDSGVSGTE